jgi:glutamyl-Q tRNA(Asp) synthetase
VVKGRVNYFLMTTTVSRFAPSPTGRLHLGHAYSAILAHDFARERGGTFLLRIEDIDGTRSRQEFIDAIVEDLTWLGLSWDGPVVRQSERLTRYDAALERLKAMDLLYPCVCTRADIAASLSAPHGLEGAYPGTCRGRAVDLSKPHSWRLDVEKALASLPLPAGEGRGPPPSGGKGEGGLITSSPSSFRDFVAPSLSHGKRELMWHDATAGWVEADPALHGDVILARKDAPASYHLAVTVDDAAQGVTDVIRGVDLFEATHVHRLLQALLDLPTPDYHHHALLTDDAGHRLAKRHNAPTLADLRASGMHGPDLVATLRAGQAPLGFNLAKT